MGDSPKWVKSKKRRKNGQATHGARKHAWRTQAAWTKKKEEEEVGENNGPLCFRPPPQVTQASRLDQKEKK